MTLSEVVLVERWEQKPEYDGISKGKGAKEKYGCESGK